jgi:hypothetical protein
MSAKHLGVDLRLPMGAMFVLLALVLVGYGLLEPGAEAPLTHTNVNLYWGILLLVFGALMFALGWRAQRGERP